MSENEPNTWGENGKGSRSSDCPMNVQDWKTDPNELTNELNEQRTWEFGSEEINENTKVVFRGRGELVTVASMHNEVG